MDHLVEQLLGPAGLLVFLLFVLFAGWRRWWVYGSALDEMTKDRDEWKRLALRGTRVVEKTLDVAEKEVVSP